MGKSKAAVVEPLIDSSATALESATYLGLSVKETTEAEAMWNAGKSALEIADYFGLAVSDVQKLWPTTLVPDIVGMTTTAADAAITAAGLTKGTTTAAAGTLNIVLTQTLVAGTTAKGGDALGYTYGDGT